MIQIMIWSNFNIIQVVVDKGEGSSKMYPDPKGTAETPRKRVKIKRRVLDLGSNVEENLTETGSAPYLRSGDPELPPYTNYDPLQGVSFSYPGVSHSLNLPEIRRIDESIRLHVPQPGVFVQNGTNLAGAGPRVEVGHENSARIEVGADSAGGVRSRYNTGEHGQDQFTTPTGRMSERSPAVQVNINFGVRLLVRKLKL